MANIRKRPSGRWQAQVRRGRGRHVITKTFRTKTQAADWARSTEDAIATGKLLDDRAARKMTVAALLKQYRKEITPRKRGQGPERSRIATLIASLGDVVLADLSAEMVVAYVDERLEQIGPSTAKKEINLLSGAINMARSLWGIRLLSNAAAEARAILAATKTIGEASARDRRVSDDELQKLAATLPGQMPELVAFAVETAMRRGEIARMRRAHRNGTTLVIAKTKTDRPRTIPLSTHAIAILDALPARIDGLVWGLAANSITQAFKRACTKAKIHDLRFHDLRHEATSRLFEKGLGIEQVATITGHADWRSLKRYTHPKPEAIAKLLG